jgi:hypothetical protein
MCNYIYVTNVIVLRIMYELEKEDSPPWLKLAGGGCTAVRQCDKMKVF